MEHPTTVEPFKSIREYRMYHYTPPNGIYVSGNYDKVYRTKVDKYILK